MKADIYQNNLLTYFGERFEGDLDPDPSEGVVKDEFEVNPLSEPRLVLPENNSNNNSTYWHNYNN